MGERLRGDHDKFRIVHSLFQIRGGQGEAGKAGPRDAGHLDPARASDWLDVGCELGKLEQPALVSGEREIARHG